MDYNPVVVVLCILWFLVGILLVINHHQSLNEFDDNKYYLKRTVYMFFGPVVFVLMTLTFLFWWFAEEVKEAWKRRLR